MSEIEQTKIATRLLRIVDELERQPEVSESYASNALPFGDEMTQIREFVVVGENGAAYESLIATIESHPFILSGKAVIALLELGLLFGYKTEREEDRVFDKR